MRRLGAERGRGGGADIYAVAERLHHRIYAVHIRHCSISAAAERLRHRIYAVYIRHCSVYPLRHCIYAVAERLRHCLYNGADPYNINGADPAPPPHTGTSAYRHESNRQRLQQARILTTYKHTQYIIYICSPLRHRIYIYDVLYVCIYIVRICAS